MAIDAGMGVVIDDAFALVILFYWNCRESLKTQRR